MNILRLIPCGALLILASGCAATVASEGAKTLQITHPDDATKRIEFFVARPEGKAPWPTVILLHGHQEPRRSGGEDFVRWGVLRQLAQRGYLAVAVSQPGYGNSTGPADFCGAFTQHAVTAVIAKLRADGQASPERLLIEGISRGAVTAGLIAAHDPSISGLIMISGVYDFPAYSSDTNASGAKLAVVAALNAETGGSPEALNARSVLRFARTIKAKSLLLHGGQDERTDHHQARRLAEEIIAHGGTANVVIYPEVGHRIPMSVRNKAVDAFIDTVLGTAR